jgi:glycerol-3-phosphate O-acyltransferase
MNFLSILEDSYKQGNIPEKVYRSCLSLYQSYAHSMEASGFNMELYDHLFDFLLRHVKEQVRHPYKFEPFHQKIREPIDYYHFGIEFIRPLVDRQKTRIFLVENVDKIQKQINQGENVILFANHQTEVDPQLMSLVLEKSHPKLGEEVIFVAGDRVLTDPMAMPFSMGRNLLCIYSKRHIDTPPEKKQEKLQHNQKTMQRMKELLSKGSKFIYVAPSGGRDRPNENGEVVVAPFDPQSIEMFRLMAKQSEKSVHFYPLSLATFDILPPPKSIESELGEIRMAKREGALFFFGNEIDMEDFPGADVPDKRAKRESRALFIWSIVKKNYDLLKGSR